MIQSIIAFFLLVSPVILLGFVCLIFGIISLILFFMYRQVRRENWEVWNENLERRGENHDLDVENAKVTERNNNLEGIFYSIMEDSERPGEPFEVEIDKVLKVTGDGKKIQIH